MIDPHASHGDVTLSLTDGGRLHESWKICACAVPTIRTLLGPPQNERPES
jgi:hypothetical protein